MNGMDSQPAQAVRPGLRAVSGWLGGSTAEEELAVLADHTADLRPIAPAEHRDRRDRLAAAMVEAGVDAAWLEAGTNLHYFTEVHWHPSERLAGAMLARDGAATFLVPSFERSTFLPLCPPGAGVATWHEHEDPGAAFAGLLRELAPGARRVALDPGTPFGRVETLRGALPSSCALVAAAGLVDACRMRKSPAEVALMQAAFDLTSTVQAATARILRPGITPAEVTRFVDAAHRALGAKGGSTFCIVLFGPDTAFPHGVASPKALEPGDSVLVDTGCRLHGYRSDLTRSYVFGAPTAHQRRVWDDERAAQDAAFAAARPGAPCSAVDAAVRALIEARGYGPGYALPGLPHRTGHGIGLDIHEAPYFVGGDETPLAEGMCLSVEPMLCVPGEFGVRLEDHLHMGAAGPVWFTSPAASVDDPFAEV